MYGLGKLPLHMLTITRRPCPPAICQVYGPPLFHCRLHYSMRRHMVKHVYIYFTIGSYGQRMLLYAYTVSYMSQRSISGICWCMCLMDGNKKCEPTCTLHTSVCTIYNVFYITAAIHSCTGPIYYTQAATFAHKLLWCGSWLPNPLTIVFQDLVRSSWITSIVPLYWSRNV